ncbi:SPOR domain-containing protein [Pseudomonas rubra]|uniref:SPOR domain-containing protein n=1 Tax=Pseudomonas rubra TaxID=2942627 RepID=A0ABT5PF62_9PSED|nr:SPOR domain-containing protein [Pseudomonas rubra]MDD1016638.1 SPOR domain-containing protein [Pseudomonas rubra]MDD1039435.1 SPOR domain-containing protein [Pseudomonas rubra]MDD1154880.1 SPOR domain-containing protein [Pseudomonas rubra]
MALLDKVVKQRMVGALVLVALAVIFLPMLFSREDEMRQVRVEAPEAPAAPTLPQVQMEPVQVPEPQVLPEEPVVVEQPAAALQAPSAPIAPAPSATPLPTPVPAPAAPVVAAKPAAPAPAKVEAKPAAKPAVSKIDANGLPVSWSIQMASLANRASADNLQKTLRSQGYNAYIRSAEGMNRVYVGPLIERAEAERLRDVINRQQKLKGFVVRFQPERS